MSKNKQVSTKNMTPGVAIGFLVDEWSSSEHKRARVERDWPQLTALIEVLAKGSPYADNRIRAN